VDPRRWARIQELFHLVVELPPLEQPGALLTAEPDDPGLRREVEALLLADREAAGPGAGGTGRRIHEVIQAVAREAAPEPPDLLPGQRVGPYRIVKELGRGGMGSVHLAERDDREYRARVAIKVIRGGPGGAHTLHRFRAERQILAGLEHPNVARLLDGGTTPEGIPWLALEYVDGEPIHRYCDRLRLPVSRRIHLFRQVCAGVEYAHRKLVVHRDLKPGNVLVTADGVPKLLDFGIAKLLEPPQEEGEDAPLETATHLRLMTPAYASPEQVRGEPVTTATDVYALGLLLYELLAGRPAQRVTSSSALEVEREVCQREPARPGARVDEAVAAARGTTTRRLAATLAGDLDNIVLTALRKEPERRYPSVAALGDDLVRYQEGRPVLARGNPWGYRAGKFARRHALPLAAAGAGVAAFVASVAFYTGRVAAERDLARLEAERAGEVAAFMADVFRQGNPDLAPGTPATARDLLDRGAERITGLESDPPVRAALLLTLGRAYEAMGEFAAAEPLVREAVEIRRMELGARGWSPERPQFTNALDALGTVLWRLGRLEEAEVVHREALEVIQAEAPGSAQAGTALNNLGKVLQERGRLEEAELLFREALEIHRTVDGPAHSSVAAILTNVAQLREGLGEREEGEALYREALQIMRALPPEDRAGDDVLVSNLGENLLGQGRLEEAEPLFREALELAEARYGPGSPAVAHTLSAMARLRARMGDHPGAEALIREALPAIQASLGPRHPDVAYELSNLAATVARQGRAAEADSLHGEAVAIARESLPEDSPFRARALNEHALFLRGVGRVPEAVTLLEEAVEVAARALSDDHPYLIRLRDLLADTRGMGG